MPSFLSSSAHDGVESLRAFWTARRETCMEVKSPKEMPVVSKPPSPFNDAEIALARRPANWCLSKAGGSKLPRPYPYVPGGHQVTGTGMVDEDMTLQRVKCDGLWRIVLHGRSGGNANGNIQDEKE